MNRLDLLRGALRAVPRPTRKRLTKRLIPYLERRGPYLADCRGVTLELDFRENSAYRYFACGETGRHLVRLLLRLLEPGASFVDAGANQGFFALLGGRAVGTSGRVVAFEPDPANCARIRRNLAHNHMPQVTLEQAALSDTDGEALFHLGRQDEVGSLLADPERVRDATLRVRTRALDGYLDAAGIQRVDVLKLDVEGAEGLAFEGMADGLARGRYRHILLEWHGDAPHAPGSAAGRGVEPLERAGYTIRRIKRRSRTGTRRLLAPFGPELLARRVHLYCRAPDRGASARGYPPHPGVG